MITITDDETKQQMVFQIRDGSVMVYNTTPSFRMTNDDARQLRRFLENVG